MLQTIFTTELRYGSIPIGFPIHLEGEYIVIAGANGSGKTSLLNALFHKNQRERVNGKTQVCLINLARSVDTLVQPSARTLEQYNAELAKAIEESNGRHHAPNPGELLTLLLNHNNFTKQVQKLNDYLAYLDLPEYTIQEIPHSFSTPRQKSLPGFGRMILPILAALSDDTIKMVLIDEIDASLDQRLKKRLRDLFYEVSAEKQIIVTSHLNTLFNRNDYTSNYFVSNKNKVFSISRVSSEEELESISSADLKLVKELAKSIPSITPDLSNLFDTQERHAGKPEDIKQAEKTVQEKYEDTNLRIFYEELKELIKHNKEELAKRYKDRVQQTNIAYYVSLICLIVSVLFVFTGTILIFIGKLEGGVLTTVSSTICSIVSGLAFVFNKQANDQEREDTRQMRTLEKSYQAMGYISCITDTAKRDELIEKMIENGFFGNQVN